MFSLHRLPEELWELIKYEESETGGGKSLMLHRVDMLRSSQSQRLNSRWTHYLKSANSMIQRSKERVVYRESQVQVASGSYSVGEERKTGMIAWKGYYDRRKRAMQ